MGRKPCCEKVGLKRGPWSIDEDRKLTNFILENGIQCWRLVPKLAGLARCGKSCRLRWMKYLRPGLIREVLTEAEENQIIELHSQLGNRWSKIAEHFPGRTDNEIKNHWNTRIKRKLKLLEKRGNCDKQEGDIQHSHNSIEELKSVDDHDHESNSSQNSSKFENGESVLSSNAEQSESVNSRSDEVSKEEDEHQWDDYVDYMDLLSWDGFSNLDDIFPVDNQ